VRSSLPATRSYRWCRGTASSGKLLRADHRGGSLGDVSLLWMLADDVPPTRAFRFPFLPLDVAFVVKPFLA
jgi:hypothetical protein